jgi:peptidoglycan/xylan/chitin deacetylase (PgdA/CDA1 family)
MISLLLLFVVLSHSKTYVSFTIDDTYDYHLNFSQILDTYNVKGTFYTNSGRIGTPSRLTLDQLSQMAASGHEIGGHTITHPYLTTLNFTQQKNEICQDRQNLISLGFSPMTFAFPFGADTPDSFRILSECGYNSARDSGGLRSNTSCFNCPVAESIPPKNPMLMRSVSYSASLGVAGIQWYIQQAQTMVDAWVMIIFHELGDLNPVTVPGRITVDELHSLVSWVKALPDTLIVHVSANVNASFYPIFNSSLTNVNAVRDIIRDSQNMHLRVPRKKTTTTSTSTSSTTSSTTTSTTGTSTTTTSTSTSTTTPTSTTTETQIGLPYVVLTFDHGTIDHLNVSIQLESFGMRGVFFVNSNTIGQPGFLTYDNLREMQLAGHEIGSKTQFNNNQLLLNSTQQYTEICTDRETLRSMNLNISSIAWPYGSNNLTVETTAQNCGFSWGRDTGGLLTFESCSTCSSSEVLPFVAPMKLRSFTVKSTQSLGNLIWQLWRAEQRSTQASVLIYSFEKVCSGCTYSSITLGQFLTFLKPRIVRGTQVVTFNQLT